MFEDLVLASSGLLLVADFGFFLAPADGLWNGVLFYFLLLVRFDD